MDAHDVNPRRADEFAAYAEEAIERSEHPDNRQDRLELLARGQAWAMLSVAALLSRLVEVLAARWAGQ